MGQMITIGYRDTLKRAQELEQLATEIERKCAARIGRLRSGMNSSWTGDSAVFYQKKLDQLESKARHRAKDLRAAALALRIAAERYRILEEVIF